MKRLFIDALGFEWGKAYGYQEYLFNLLSYFFKQIDKIEYDEVIIVCNKTQYTHFLQFEDKIHISPIKCGNSSIQRTLKHLFLPIIAGIKENDTTLYPGNYSSAIKKGKNILVIHDLIFKNGALLKNKFYKLKKNILVPISINYADKIISISNSTREDIEKFYPNSKQKIVIINNYFNFRKFHTTEEIKEKKNQFISICSDAYHKNTITVLKAFELYCKNNGKYNIVFIGAIKPNTKLYDFYLSLDSNIKSRVMLYNHISTDVLSSMYHESNAYISASLFEGLGMPIIEAMYFKLPVLLSNIKVLKEVSLGYGYYFEPHSFRELADLMLKIENSYNNTKEASKLITEQYSENNTSQKYIDLLNTI